ncbi:MAG: cell division protein FtsL [Deltaproteobacteria bacterium]|nr:MAG: cell division protein FtsL [Deltaproteobacteria bacterium]
MGKTLLSPLLVIALLLASSLFHVWSQLQILKLGYQLSQATAVHEGLSQENAQARLEVATLKAPERIEGIARGTLGLNIPQPEQIIVIK